MILFLSFTWAGFISSLSVVFSTNPVYSALYLILTFFISSCLLVFFGLEFLPIIVVVIYVGAVAVLFLFVLLMLNIKTAENKQVAFAIIPVLTIFLLLFGSIFYLLLSLEILPLFSNFLASFYITDFIEFTTFDFFSNISSLFNISSLGGSIFTRYLYSFLLSGIILLLAMLSTITITLQRNFSSKSQLIYNQVLANQKNIEFI
jgi:NADH-quinone oxidoreductase subunit J